MFRVRPWCHATLLGRKGRLPAGALARDRIPVRVPPMAAHNRGGVRVLERPPSAIAPSTPGRAPRSARKVRIPLSRCPSDIGASRTITGGHVQRATVGKPHLTPVEAVHSSLPERMLSISPWPLGRVPFFGLFSLSSGTQFELLGQSSENPIWSSDNHICPRYDSPTEFIGQHGVIILGIANLEIAVTHPRQAIRVPICGQAILKRPEPFNHRAISGLMLCRQVPYPQPIRIAACRRQADRKRRDRARPEHESWHSHSPILLPCSEPADNLPSDQFCGAFSNVGDCD